MNLEDTARKLDEGIRSLLDARDTIYQVEKLTMLAPDQRETILADVQRRTREAAAAIARIDIAHAGEEEDEHA